MSPEPTQAPPWLAKLSLALVLATGLYGSIFWISHESGPKAQAIAQGARSLRAGHKPGDLIFLLPAYATRAREHLGDLHPLAVRKPLREDISAHSRFWVFGLFGAAEALRPQAQAAGHKLLESKHPAEGITLDLYEVAGQEEVVYDFLEQLKQAKVWHEQGDKRTPCDKWSRANGQGGAMGRWMCPKDRDWFYVSPEWHRMGDHLRLCLWAHPPSQGRLVISYPNVPLTGHLSGRAGHTLNASVRAHASVMLDVQVKGQNAQRFEFLLEEHFEPFKLRTPNVGTATVSFAVSSPNAGANHFCFIADMRRAKKP